MARLVTVLGNRPQFIKAAIVGRRWREQWPKNGSNGELTEYLVHTGQHYDPMLSDVFFDQLGIAAPDVNLQVGSGPVLDQIGVMLPMLRKVFEEQKPDAVMVYGDTNSTVAAALAAAHLHIPLIHVEAGERNYRRLLAPEEVNRVVTDELAWLCLTSTEKAARYLEREGFGPGRVRWVGDPMYDLFRWAQPLVDDNATVTPQSLGLRSGGYVLATIHRNENTASTERLVAVLTALDNAALPVVLPLHPRVRNMLGELGWEPRSSLRFIEPVGYFDMIGLLRDCAVCVTDSGGVSREAFFSGRPSVVPLPNSGWNEIVEAGWLLVEPWAGEALTRAIDTFRPDAPLPQGLFGDGFAAVKMGEAILEMVATRREEGAWHPGGTFGDIPQPVDETANTYDAFRARVKALQAAGAIFDADNISLVHGLEIDTADAVALAEIEAELGVHATYVLRIDGAIINPAAGSTVSALKQIAAFGHAIALRGASAPALKAGLEQLVGVSFVDVPKGQISDFEAVAGPARLLVALGPSNLGPNPVSTFERASQIADAAYDRAWADLGMQRLDVRRPLPSPTRPSGVDSFADLQPPPRPLERP